MTASSRPPVLLVALLLAACAPASPDEDPTPDPEPTPQTSWPEYIGPSDRLAKVVVPEDYDGLTPMPVVVLLHGFSVNAEVQDFYFRYSNRVTEDQFLLVLPDGTANRDGDRYWNATDGCCDRYDEGVDDVAYLAGLLDAMEASFHTDPDRVLFAGHSNGGFMSYRMACDLGERIAAIAPLAGSTWLDEADCGDPPALSVLHVHPEADTSVPYEGRPGLYPGAVEAVERWASRAGCDLDGFTEDERLDLVSGIEGEETRVRDYAGCDAGLAVSLWSIEEGSHAPVFSSEWAARTLGWLLERRRVR